MMEEWFFQEQLSHRHNPKFLRKVAIQDIRRADHLHSGPVPNDYNDANLGAVTDNDENGDVTLVNVIELKGVAWELDLSYKPVYEV